MLTPQVHAPLNPIDHMFEENAINEAIRAIVRWFSSSSEWLELECDKLRSEVDYRQWQAENETMSTSEGTFCWEFIEEWE